MARGYVEHRGQRSSGKDGLPATLDMNREFGQTSIWWPLRFLTSVLNPLVSSQLEGGLGSVGLHVVREKHIAAALADFDSWECVVVGKEGPGSKAAWVLRSS